MFFFIIRCVLFFLFLYSLSIETQAFWEENSSSQASCLTLEVTPSPTFQLKVSDGDSSPQSADWSHSAAFFRPHFPILYSFQWMKEMVYSREGRFYLFHTERAGEERFPGAENRVDVI